MYRKIIVIFIIVSIVSIYFSACSKIDNENEEPIDGIMEQINNMSLEEKIGQMLIVGMEGYEIDENIKELINKYYVGGFILFKKNIESAQQLINLTNDLKKLNEQNLIPLFLSIDEEGGSISRLPPEFIKSESNRVIGENNDPLLSFEIGGIIAKQIKSLGFNINFAPVLDIDSNPNNPVIGDRSFGPDPNLVSELGIATMKGIQSQNIVPVIKHFPGHGDTDTDSHLGLPSVDKSFNDLMQFELIPFKNAIEDGADAVMVAHILYEMIDPLYPSTLSETIIQDLLRDQLGFNGIVITDDMTMGAIMDNYDVTEASIQSIKAGCDIVLICHGYENIINVLEALKRAVENNEITEDRINQSVYRILTIKHKYGIENNRIEDIDIEQLNSEMESLLNNLTR